jgi:hypothetical protein
VGLEQQPEGSELLPIRRAPGRFEELTLAHATS